MRIATSQLFDRSASLMTSLNGRADLLQTQIATGVRILNPSDDAPAYLRLSSLNRDAARDATYGANIRLAQSVTAQADSALSGIETQLQRALELAMQAANGTLSDANRAPIATALQATIDDLLALANSKDVRGQPLFAGAEGDSAYVRGDDGTISYAGSGEPAGIPIGEGSAVPPTVTGERAFAAGESDMFAVLAALSAALAAGGDLGEASDDAISGIQASLESVTTARASIGARAMRLDLETERLDEVSITREETRQGIDGVDVAAAITELQKTLTVLQATQASFTKLSSLSLFDYLR
jgi:flagellar hook-associated protein 3 FlgL